MSEGTSSRALGFLILLLIVASCDDCSGCRSNMVHFARDMAAAVSQ